MQLAIIETGRPPEPLQNTWPDYPAMFRALLAPEIPELSTTTISLIGGDRLPDTHEQDAILITGSPYGVYDSEPWIETLIKFIQATAKSGTPQIGICFGHQILAKAFGADVGKSEKGWGIGRHVYDIIHRPDWMQNQPASQFALGVSHQDQVKSLAEHAIVVASSDFTPYAALHYPQHKAISFQGHPEFSAEFSCALYDIRRGTKLSDDQVRSAHRSLSAPVDNELVGRWIAQYLKTSLGR
ncbi:MAG: glutamine amidotransferase-related protein [Henriciella sp.]